MALDRRADCSPKPGTNFGQDVPVKIAIASDHAGFVLKIALADFVASLGHEVTDLGPETADRVDYPDFAKKVATLVQSGEADRGVLVCGSGVGMSIAANRFSNVRAVLCMNTTQAALSRAHNDANVVCVGERLVGVSLAEDIIKTFLSSDFEGGRHTARVQKIETS